MDTIAKKGRYNESVTIGETEETKARRRKIQKRSWEKDYQILSLSSTSNSHTKDGAT